MARILCVEDEPEIRADLVEELIDSGHDVVSAANGAEGLSLAQSFRPDIIICDCLMPVMNGAEMFASLRDSYESFATTPFVFLSAHAQETHKQAGLDAGADVYLTKPVDFEQLQDVVSGLLAAYA